MEVLVARRDAEVAIVTIRGQLDMDTAQDLQAAFDRLRVDSVSRVVADLSHLTFCDSIGLSTLVLTHRYCVSAGGWLRLAGPTPFLARLLAVVGISEVVPVYQSPEGALVGDPADLCQDTGEVNV
jgi:anti-sigma B factor antagonist